MTFSQSTIDRFTAVVLLVMFIGAFISVAINYYVIHQLKVQQQQFHSQNIQAENTIIQTQKIYFNCLLGLNPKGNIKSQEKTCFDKVPIIRP